MDSDTAPELYTIWSEAKNHIEQGDYDKAIEIYKYVLIRYSDNDIAVELTPPMQLSLEQAIDFINNDELVEVTPGNIRLRKKLLTQAQRLRDNSSSRRSVK